MPRGAHSPHTGNRRAKLEVNLKRTDDARRAAIHATGDARRADVYRADVPFAGSDAYPRLPGPGADRDLLAAQVRKLREAGASYVKISEELGYAPSSIRLICTEYSIEKGKT